MSRLLRTGLIVAWAACMLFTAAPGAAADDPFYRGKRLNLMINFAPGGPTDIEGRLLARHIARHIDGHPAMLVQNRDGAGGLVGTNYIGEVAPRDGTMFAYLTSPAWRSVIDPDVYRVDFKTFEFIGLQSSNAVYYVRADLPPGIRRDVDLMQAQGLVAAGLAADTSKDLLLRLTLDMLGLRYRYVTGYRSANAARLAVERGEASMHSESLPGYFAVVEPNLVQTGKVVPTWYDPSYDGKAFSAPKVMQGLSIPAFPDFYRKVKGGEPAGILWEVYRANLAVDQSMLRAVVMPPGSPAAAVDALRAAIGRLNDDPDYAEDAIRTMQFAPRYETGADLNMRVRNALVVGARRQIVRGRLSQERQPLRPRAMGPGSIRAPRSGQTPNLGLPPARGGDLGRYRLLAASPPGWEQPAA
jgi:tripartite-type tricarboxylate transporter receptor subunit TctC